MLRHSTEDMAVDDMTYPAPLLQIQEYDDASIYQPQSHNPSISTLPSFKSPLQTWLPNPTTTTTTWSPTQSPFTDFDSLSSSASPGIFQDVTWNPFDHSFTAVQHQTPPLLAPGVRNQFLPCATGQSEGIYGNAYDDRAMRDRAQFVTMKSIDEDTMFDYDGMEDEDPTPRQSQPQLQDNYTQPYLDSPIPLPSQSPSPYLSTSPFHPPPPPPPPPQTRQPAWGHPRTRPQTQIQTRSRHNSTSTTTSTATSTATTPTTKNSPYLDPPTRSYSESTTSSTHIQPPPAKRRKSTSTNTTTQQPPIRLRSTTTTSSTPILNLRPVKGKGKGKGKDGNGNGNGNGKGNGNVGKNNTSKNNHNQVEKQYRNRLNGQFETLLSALPHEDVAPPLPPLLPDQAPNSLSFPPPNTSSSQSFSPPLTNSNTSLATTTRDSRDVQEPRRVSKAEVLVLAQKHIRRLEKEERVLEGINEGLRGRVEELKRVFVEGGGWCLP